MAGIWNGARGLIAGSALILLAACAQASAHRETEKARFASAEYGLSLAYPASFKAEPGFKSGYFLSTRWNPDAAKGVPGRGLLTLTLPESNKLTTAELRLGVSDDIQNCALPNDGNTGSTSTVAIDGVKFKRRDTGDAGMSHFLQRHAYRGVAHGHCYAIDLVVDGTNPGVYPGKPKPPMSQQAAFKRLTALLNGLRFSDS